MRLLICDDDISTVDVIQNQLNCAELGISGILRAYNGAAAIDIIARESPELILCDIGMPIRSGIDVLKYVYENKISTEFSFLTCHEDFEYAKAALLYGASDYITKPFEMEELKISLQRMIASSRQKHHQAKIGRQTQFDSVLSSVLRQISDGLYGTDRSTIHTLLLRNGLNFRAADRWHMVVSCADVTDAVREVWSQELLTYTIGRLHDETLVDYIGSAYTLTHTEDRFVWCTCFVPEAACPDAALEERCENLMSLCEDHMSLNPVILVSDSFPLCEAYTMKTRMHSRMRRIRYYAGKICHIWDEEASQGQSDSFLDAPQVHWYLKKHDAQGFRDYIEAVTKKLANSRNYTRQVMDNLRRELIHVFSASLRDNDLPTAALFEDGNVHAMNDRAVQSVENMRRFAELLFRVTEEKLQSLADSDDIIARVEAYIHTHFRENINREDVAAIAYITPNYLSKQFRNKKGMNLREYINQIRIEEAKRLLLTTNLSVSEVAGLSGYENISYFSTVFRKHTGMSPVDWRNFETVNGDHYEAD